MFDISTQHCKHPVLCAKHRDSQSAWDTGCEGAGLCTVCRGLQKVMGGFAQAISVGAGDPPWCVLP